MKTVDVESSTCINFKLVIMLKYKNIEIFLQKVTNQIGLKKFFLLKT